MLSIPNRTRTISQLVESQLPSFVREDYPQFIAFLTAYYQWMETNGIEVYSGVLAAADLNEAVLAGGGSSDVNAYENMNLVVLNGPAKGYTRSISSYDPGSQTLTLYEPWANDKVPPAKSKVAIRDNSHPGKLLDYRDIDKTLDGFVNAFRDEFMYQIPGAIAADQATVLKHVKSFYQSRGTEESFRVLLRMLVNEEIGFYYPKVDLFRASDANWAVQQVMRVTTAGNTYNWQGRQITGTLSGATANVEKVLRYLIEGFEISDLYLSSVNGAFVIDPLTGQPEVVKISYPYIPPDQTELGNATDLLEPGVIVETETPYQIVTEIVIDDPGTNYSVGDQILVATDSGILGKAVVSAVQATYYSGRVDLPPAQIVFDPFFGPDASPQDGLNAIAGWGGDTIVPGLFFFGHVVLDGNLITGNEIMLSSNEDDQDDFYAGAEISLTVGLGVGQRRMIIAYNGATKVATVDQPFAILPDRTTEYMIVRNRGGIKAVEITDFGLSV